MGAVVLERGCVRISMLRGICYVATGIEAYMWSLAVMSHRRVVKYGSNGTTIELKHAFVSHSTAKEGLMAGVRPFVIDKTDYHSRKNVV